MRDKGTKTKTQLMQKCRQLPEMEDCFARSRQGNCAALADTDYPCGHCPFYKPLMVWGTERKRTYDVRMYLDPLSSFASSVFPSLFSRRISSLRISLMTLSFRFLTM